MRELAAQGFRAPAPECRRANMIEPRPDRHCPRNECDVEAGLNALLARRDVCRGPAGIIALPRGPYVAIRLAPERPQHTAAPVSSGRHVRDPNASAPQRLFSIALAVNRIGAAVPMLTGDVDFALRRIVKGRA